MKPSSTAVTNLAKTIDEFVEAFNVNDLDRVMLYFADSAVYLPGDGSRHCGIAAIRAAFEPQFSGSFGSMRFDEHERLIDSDSRKAVIRWVCRHDLAGAKSAPLWVQIQRLAVRLTVGSRFGWEGLDVFHFDSNNKIVGKFTYANYSRPQLKKELGVPLAQRKA